MLTDWQRRGDGGEAADNTEDVCVCVCVRACVRACVRVSECVRACLRMQS